MRKLIALIIAAVLLFSLCACNQTTELEIITPVSFYYHNDLDSKENFNDIFVAEIHEGNGYQNDQIALINQYLTGPTSENLVDPFPSDLKALSLEVAEDTVHIVLSIQITKLSGLDLTLACSCLSMTLFELMQCDYVEISAENSLLAGQESIVIAQDSLLFADDT